MSARGSRTRFDLESVHSGEEAGGGNSTPRGTAPGLSYPNFDPEAQTTPRSGVATPGSHRAPKYYIQEYNMNGSSFPVQEVIANTNIALEQPQYEFRSGLNTGATSPAMSSRRRSPIHSQGQSLLRLDQFFASPGGTENGSIVMNDMEDMEDPNDPLAGPPIVVKPKVLQQNPQTPTVLPSNYQPVNNWSKFRAKYLKEALAEFLGTLILVLFGGAVGAQVNISAQSQKNSFDNALSALNTTGVDPNMLNTISAMKNLFVPGSAGTFDDVAMGWAGGVAMAYFAAGGGAVSGAHLNPGLTLNAFIFRGLPLVKVPIYWTAQMFGGWVGGLIVFMYYRKAISENFDDYHKLQQVAGFFCTFPLEYLSPGRQFVSELLCSALLQIGIFSMTDPYTALSTHIFPVGLFILIFTLLASLALQTGAAMNPARDLGPRMALYTVGFDRHMLWVAHHHYCWVPIVGPLIGTMLGALVYDVAIYQGHESPVNWPMEVHKELLLRTWHKRPWGKIEGNRGEYLGKNGLDNVKLRRTSTGPQPEKTVRFDEEDGEEGNQVVEDINETEIPNNSSGTSSQVETMEKNAEQSKLNSTY